MLNNIIRNGSRNIEYPQYFIDNERTVRNMNDVVNGINNFFVSVGPRLAEKIKSPQIEIGKVKAVDFLDSNPDSMYLKRDY